MSRGLFLPASPPSSSAPASNSQRPSSRLSGTVTKCAAKWSGQLEAPRHVGNEAPGLQLAGLALAQGNKSHRDRLEASYHLEQRLARQTAAAAVDRCPDILDPSPLTLAVQLNDPPSLMTKEPPTACKGGKEPDFYPNAGEAIRILREDIPQLFYKDLQYHIFRDDITFKDPRNSFAGKKNYSTIFWSLRFHGRIFFRSLYVDVQRIWQPEETVIRMRWTVHGIPRVPWEAEGIFDGISQYKLDNHGKIYEHAVDNVILRDPPFAKNPIFSGLNLIPRMQQQQPCPGAWYSNHQEAGGEQGKLQRWLTRFSWVRLYAALWTTVQAVQVFEWWGAV